MKIKSNESFYSWRADIFSHCDITGIIEPHQTMQISSLHKHCRLRDIERGGRKDFLEARVLKRRPQFINQRLLFIYIDVVEILFFVNATTQLPRKLTLVTQGQR